MKILITGAAGFIGGFLARLSLEQGSTLLGIDLGDPGENWPGGAFEVCDVRDAAHFSNLLSKFRPERVFHLAAQSYPTVSLTHPRETLETNVVGTVNLFEGLRSAGLMPRVVVACSSAEYGPVAAQDLPVRETHPLRPLHPYGVSKVGQDLLAAQYFSNYGFHAIRIRIFNTTGPGKLGDVCSDLAKRAVEIELGMRPPVLMAGNLTTRRALADVRDTSRGLWIAAERCEAGEVYNVGGSQIYAVQEIIDAIRKDVSKPFTVEQDPALVRKCDEPTIAGDTAKFRDCTGWQPEIDLSGTIRDMLGWWRNRLGSAHAARKAGL